MFFDTNAHPTLNGQWTSGRNGITFAAYVDELHSIGGGGALAVGLPSVGDYAHRAYFDTARRHDLIPVAGISCAVGTELEDELREVISIGFECVKVHPRLMQINQSPNYLEEILVKCGQRDLKVLLCTYFGSSPGHLPTVDPFIQVCRALNRVPHLRLLLLHAGVTRILDYSLLARHAENVFLDLSYTLMKYQQSSLGLDVKFLFSDLDQKLTVGSDSPEFRLVDVRETIEGFLCDVEGRKREHILHRNIERFLEMS
jgi:predicted TIM-barrel fold metal-dependent hydrolase